jgi:hypothetical protein
MAAYAEEWFEKSCAESIATAAISQLPQEFRLDPGSH